jgi:acetyl esterase/lipase
VIDVKKVIAWAHAHAAEYGLDPNQVFVSSSSSGAHLAITAALTVGDPAFKANLEQLDAAVAGAIGLYGYYGPAGGPGQHVPSAPADHVRPDAPPVLIVSGGQDTLVPAAHTTRLVSTLRKVSRNPAVYAELPHAQHTFDLLHSVRMASVIDGIDAFVTACLHGRSRDNSECGGDESAVHTSRRCDLRSDLP